MRSISIQEFFWILRRGLVWLIIIPLIVASAVGVYYVFCVENQYTSETKLYILVDYGASMGENRYDVTTSTSLAYDYQRLINTHEVLTSAAKKLGVKSLEGFIDVAYEENTRMINLSVTSTDPVFCQNAANTISDVFIEYLRTISQTKSVSVASRALLPSAPSGPNRIRNIALSLIISILFVVGTLVALAMKDTTLLTADDIENHLKISVLAHIACCKKEIKKFMSQKGVRMPLYYCVSRDMRESIKTLSMNLQFLSGGDAVKTLTVTSASPSEGKSTIAVMLATALVEEGKRVLLCDMDLCSCSLGEYYVRTRQKLIDVMRGTTNVNQVIMESDVRGLFLVARYHKQANITQTVRSPQFQGFIEDMRRQFDYILFDAPSVGFSVEAAMLASITDGTLLVIASGQVEWVHEKEIIAQLKNANASIIGAALNFINDHYDPRKSRGRPRKSQKHTA